MTDRWIELDGIVNMRDVGGLPTRDGGHTASGRLIRSDNLQDLTEADVQHLVEELGVTDVVDLRTETELHLEGPGPLQRVELQGARDHVRHHHHSLIEERAPEESVESVGVRALPWRGDDPIRDASFWAEHYLGYLDRRPDSVVAALEVVASAEGAVVVHCAAGKDRTGTVVAMALDVAGVPHDEIVADYVLTGERLERIVARLMPRDAYGPALAQQKLADQMPRAESMRAILDAVDEGWGGAGGWLLAHGWSQAEVERLRARLTEPAPADVTGRRAGPGSRVVMSTPPLPGQPGFVVPAPQDRPRTVRRAVRVIVVDEHDRMLLLQDSDLGLDPVLHWWVTPGGGVDPGESDLEAGVRELWEETGLVVQAGDLVGPLLTREVVHGYSDKIVDQVEVFYVVRVPAFEVDTSAHTEEERLTVADIRWWTLADLASTTDVVWPGDVLAVLALASQPDRWRDGAVQAEPLEESTLPAS